MHRYLIFRTDRIGDFIFSRMLIRSIKEANKKNIIDVVCSKYNYNYIKNFRDINKLYILDKYDFNLLIKNRYLINKNKYDFLIILDSKRRSIFYSIFLKSKIKIAVLKDFRPNLILKIFFHKYFINSEVNSQFVNFLTVGNYLNIKQANPISYYDNYKLAINKIKYLNKNSILLHLDEKWFEGYYHKDYTYMNLNSQNFNDLILVIFKKFKKNIILTSGGIDVNELDEIIKNNFFHKERNVYFSNKYKNKLIYVKKTNFRELESIVQLSSLIICCEGAISHVSNAFSKNTIALINKKNLNTALFWTKHMKNIKLIYRDKLNSINKQIKNVKF